MSTLPRQPTTSLPRPRTQPRQNPFSAPEDGNDSAGLSMAPYDGSATLRSQPSFAEQPQQQYAYGNQAQQPQYGYNNQVAPQHFDQNHYASQQTHQFYQPQPNQYYGQQQQQHYYEQQQQQHKPPLVQKHPTAIDEHHGQYYGASRSVEPLNEYEMDEVVHGIRKDNGIKGFLSIPPKYQLAMEKYLCCCCPKNKKHRMICGGVVLLVLIILGVIAYLFIPRYPQILVYGINLSEIGKTGSPYSFSYTKPDTQDLNFMRFQMNLTMTLGTTNPNPYDLHVDSIDLVARILVNTSQVYNQITTSTLLSYNSVAKLIPPPPPTPGYHGSNNSVVGTANHSSIIFPSKATVNYTMLFLLDYSPDSKLGLLQDPTVLEIADCCGITDRSGKQRPMQISYDAKSVIGALQPLGFVPTLSSVIRINCPFSQPQIQAVIKQVEQGQSVMQALQQVFGGGAGSVAPPPVGIIPDAPPAGSGPNSGSGSGSGSGNSTGNGGASATVDSGSATETVAPTDDGTGGNVASESTVTVNTRVPTSVATGAVGATATTDTIVPTGDVLVTTVDVGFPEPTTGRRNGGGGQDPAVPTSDQQVLGSSSHAGTQIGTFSPASETVDAVRSPCPALNALANHGYLPRNGKNITADMLVSAVKQVYNMDPTVLISQVFPLRDDAKSRNGVRLASEVLADGTEFLNLDDLCLPHKMEHDVSLTRNDYAFGDNHSVNPALVDALIASSSDGVCVSADDLVKYRLARYWDSKKKNKTLQFGPIELMTAHIESAVALDVFGRDDKIPLEFVRSFFLHERIPDNWIKPKQLINLALLGIQVAKLTAKWEFYLLTIGSKQPKLPHDSREFELVRVPSAEIDKYIVAGNASNVDSRVPEMYHGIFYTDGNPTAGEVCSLAFGTWHEDENAYYWPGYNAKTFSYDDNNAGRDLYIEGRAIQTNFKVTFDKDTGVAHLLPIFNITLGSVDFYGDLPDWLTWLTIVPTENPNIFYRETSILHREPARYNFVRIVNGDGTRTPEYESIYLKSINNPADVNGVKTHLGDSQLVPVLKQEPVKPELYHVEITTNNELAGLAFSNLRIQILHSVGSGPDAKVVQSQPLKLKKLQKSMFDITCTQLCFDTFEIDDPEFTVSDHVHAITIEARGAIVGKGPVQEWFLESVTLKKPDGAKGDTSFFFPVHSWIFP
ncbi:hypothetical protein HDU98_012205, partial [Podochytrium sp. JEL0797]